LKYICSRVLLRWPGYQWSSTIPCGEDGAGWLHRIWPGRCYKESKVSDSQPLAYPMVVRTSRTSYWGWNDRCTYSVHFAV